MEPNNKLSRTLSFIERLPAPVQSPLLSFLVGRTVRFVGTAGLAIESLESQKSLVSLKNRKKVQNHIHTVHAAAMSLLAEAATGMVFSMNVRDDCIYVMKSMNIDFVNRAKGDLKAEATLSEDACEKIRKTTSGELSIPVNVSDAEGCTPIECNMIWAWRPAKPVISAKEAVNE